MEGHRFVFLIAAFAVTFVLVLQHPNIRSHAVVLQSRYLSLFVFPGPIALRCILAESGRPCDTADSVLHANTWWNVSRLRKSTNVLYRLVSESDEKNLALKVSLEGAPAPYLCPKSATLESFEIGDHSILVVAEGIPHGGCGANGYPGIGRKIH